MINNNSINMKKVLHKNRIMIEELGGRKWGGRDILAGLGKVRDVLKAIVKRCV